MCLTLLTASEPARAEFRFTVTTDSHGYNTNYAEVLDEINTLVGGPGAFHISCGDAIFSSGDIENVRQVIDQSFGNDFPWYLAVGNHDLPGIQWFHDEYDTGNGLRTPLKLRTNQDGPAGAEETIFTWDYGNAHFVFLNVYWDGTSDTNGDGDIVPALYDWLAADLAANDRPVTFVIGHEPAFPYNRHIGDSLDAHEEHRDAFWQLLEDYDVTAYLCGHTHYYSTHQGDKDHVGEVWQVNPAAAGIPFSAGPPMFMDVTVGRTEVTFAAYENSDGWHPLASWSVPIAAPGPAVVAGRYLYYHHSIFDAPGNTAAIALDKESLRPGCSATFDNYSSYSRGINGLIVDIDHLARPGELSLDDFAFRVGNGGNPFTWTPAADPQSMTVLPGQGEAESDRIVFTWADGAIQNQWLETTILAGEATGLETADIFYFGNAIGETGDREGDARIDATDLLGVRNHPRGPGNPALLENVYDFNRDGRVDAADLVLARDSVTSPLEALHLITLPPVHTSIPPISVPEPSAVLLLGIGLVVGTWGRKRGKVLFFHGF